MKLSVVIPAYNEAANLGSGSLDQVYEYLKDQKYSYEVLIIDDGSKDKTAELIEQQIKNKPGFRLIRNPHGGKALTVISGMLQTKGEISVFTDMDQATPIDQIEKFFPKFEEGYDIVIGSRHGRKGAPLARKLAAWSFASLRNIIVGLPYQDTQCGFKAFNQASIRAVFPVMQEIWEEKKASGAAVNAGFDVETLFIAKKKGFKVAEVPVNWRHVGSERVQIISDGIDAIKDMLRMRRNELQGKYG